MAYEAQFSHGSPVMIDYTPSGADVAAGEIVLVGELPCVAHRVITDGTLGDLAAGFGVYKVKKSTSEAMATAGTRVYFNASANQVTATASTHKSFGITVAAAAETATTVLVLHLPGITALA